MLYISYFPIFFPASHRLPCLSAELKLAGNSLHRLPEEIGSLLHLRAIDLSRNRFRRFPEPLASAPALETIDLQENEIAGDSEKGDLASPEGCC